MTSDIPTAQNVTGTNNPQSSQGSTPGASDANLFQKSADPEALKQNRALQVVKTGQPVTAANQSAAHNPWAIIALIVVAAVALAAGVYVYRLTGRTPKNVVEPEVEQPKPRKPVVAAVSASALTAKKPVPKGKKKQPRSKRNK